MMQNDVELWAWVNQVVDVYDEARFWVSARRCQRELQEAGYRTTPPPEDEEADWVLVFDITDGEHGKRSSIPQWRPRALWEAYHAAQGTLSHFMNE